MSEVYLLVAFVFLAVAAIRLLMSLCSNIRKKKDGGRNKNHPVVSEPPDPRQHAVDNQAVDVFIIDMGVAIPASYCDLWDEQPPPAYEDAVRLSPYNSQC
jgi:hypothetical protein